MKCQIDKMLMIKKYNNQGFFNKLEVVVVDPIDIEF